jgi:hypothetical protein
MGAAAISVRRVAIDVSDRPICMRFQRPLLEKKVTGGKRVKGFSVPWAAPAGMPCQGGLQRLSLTMNR